MRRNRKIFDIKKSNSEKLEKSGMNNSKGINEIISFYFNNSIKNQRDENLNFDIDKILKVTIHNALAIEYILKEGFGIDPEKIYKSKKDED